MPNARLNMPKFFVFGWNFSFGLTFNWINFPSVTLGIDQSTIMMFSFFCINLFYALYVYNYFRHDKKYTARRKREILDKQIKESEIGKGKIYHWIDFNTDRRAIITAIVETVCLTMLKRAFGILYCIEKTQCWACGVEMVSEFELKTKADGFAVMLAVFAGIAFGPFTLFMSFVFIKDNCPFMWLRYDEIGKKVPTLENKENVTIGKKKEKKYFCLVKKYFHHLPRKMTYGRRPG
jgi:hypothetical protein